MGQAFCPGSRLLRQPAPELFPCPNCGTEVEIWTDEFKRVCPTCRKVVFRPGGMSCLDWCKFAKDCVGEATFETYQVNRALGMRQRLLEALELHFGPDRRSIAHAQEVLAEAEELMQVEEADWHIVVPAALLHDVGPDGARTILLKLGFQMRDIDEVCAILGCRLSPDEPAMRDNPNLRALHDADCLVNLEETAAGKSREELATMIVGLFLTPTGRRRAEQRCLDG